MYATHIMAGGRSVVVNPRTIPKKDQRIYLNTSRTGQPTLVYGGGRSDGVTEVYTKPGKAPVRGAGRGYGG